MITYPLETQGTSRALIKYDKISRQAGGRDRRGGGVRKYHRHFIETEEEAEEKEEKAEEEEGR